MSSRLPYLVIFTGSFLLFGVQPMVGSTLLPVFGGTAAVWTVCLAAYQTLLLAGYAYAHAIARDGTQHPLRAAAVRDWTLRLHLALLAAATALTFGVGWIRPRLDGWVDAQALPVLSVLFCVLLLSGAPYVLLSANASLVQAWLSRRGRRDVYHLYAVSNAGSFCGLLAYPLLVEPHVSLTLQWHGFAAGVGIYTLMLGWMMRGTGSTRVRLGGTPSPHLPGAAGTAGAAGEGGTSGPPVTPGTAGTTGAAGQRGAGMPACPGGALRAAPPPAPLLWLLLPAISTFALNAVTAHLGNDVTPLPLLWAVLLAVYLLSYVIGFTAAGRKLLPRLPWAMLPLLLLAAWQWGATGGRGFAWQVAIGILLLLLGGTMLHAWLYDSRPAGAWLTRFYLCIAVGGALGGLAASIAAPLIFRSIAEYPLTLLVLAAATGAVAVRRGPAGALAPPRHAMAAAAGLVGAVLLLQTVRTGGTVVKRMRNFYGCGRVRQEQMQVRGGVPYRANLFDHSGTLHGFQALGAERHIPTLCFTRHAGGLSIVRHPRYTSTNTMRVAVAGMGIGTLAAYGRPGDTYRFYEINPQVAELARDESLFTFIKDSSAQVEIVVDDARRALETERRNGEEKWDVLIIDVYSGDAIPPHLATQEAFQLYLDRLKPDGVLSLHLTNWHLNLSPMVKAAARAFDLHLQGFGCWADKYSHGSYWTFLTRDPVDLYESGKHGRVDYATVRDIPLMTDERHSLLPYLSRNPMPAFDAPEGGRITRPPLVR